MIICYINGNPAYPSTSSSIKVTFENAAIKERESRTQELTFNLDIPDNRKVFGAVNRIDVSKSLHTSHSSLLTSGATCRLYADNLLVIEGEGTVTSYSDTEVKLQIKTATAASQFPDSFSSLYIDRVADFLTAAEIALDKQLQDDNGFYLVPDYLKSEPLMPVYDEANARWLNCPCFYPKTSQMAIGCYAPQPYLKDVIARIVYALGYAEKGGQRLILTQLSPIDFFEQKPWSKLHVLNCNPSLRYRNMLPHWTVGKFFTELENLFNLRFLFDEKTMTVTVSEGLKVSSGECHYDCLDEFSSDYDEDDETLLQSSNLAYNTGGSENWDSETLSQDVVAQFPIVDYSAPIYLYNDFDNNMTDEQKLTRLFRTPRQMYYARHTYDDDGNETGIELTGVPLANLIRQPESDETFELNIVPACIAKLEVEARSYNDFIGTTFESIGKGEAFVPTTAESKTMITDGTESYVTVENVVNGEDSDKTEEQERMEIYFIDEDDKTLLTCSGATIAIFYIHGCHTYYTNADGTKTYDSTLSLCDTKTAYSIANFHSQSARVDNHYTIVIKFEADDLPDPRKTYVFRGKRFLCDKIELEITADGISKIKTGYFFEMQ